MVPNPSADLNKLQHQIRITAGQTLQLCEQLEQGRADQPLTDEARAVHAEPEDALPLAIGLLLDPALAPEIAGPRDAEQAHSTGEASNGLLERTGSPELVELEQLDLAAVATIEFALQNPRALSPFLHRADVLVLIGAGDSEPSSGDLEFATELSGLVPAVLPIVLTRGEGLPQRGWWTTWHPVPTCSRLPVRADRPPAGESENAELASALRTCGRAARLGRILELVEAENKTHCEHLEARKALLRARSQPAQPKQVDTSQKSLVDGVKSSIEKELAELNAGISEINRKANLPDSTEARRLQKLVDELAPGDLEREQGSRAIKLSLRSDFVARIERATLDQARQRLRDDLELAGDALDLLEQRVSSQLAELATPPTTVRVPRPDEARMWDAMADEVRTDLQYRGELPRRTFMQRILVGRRPMFLVMMVLPVIGRAVGLGASRNAWPVSVAMALLFLGGFTWTFFSWRKEDDDLIEKELHKVMGSLRGELRKLLANVERERATRTQAFLTETKKLLFQVVDSAAQRGKQARAESTEAHRRDARERGTSVDRQLRERQALSPKLGKIRQAAAEAVRTAGALVRATAKGSAS